MVTSSRRFERYCKVCVHGRCEERGRCRAPILWWSSTLFVNVGMRPFYLTILDLNYFRHLWVEQQYEPRSRERTGWTGWYLRACPGSRWFSIDDQKDGQKGQGAQPRALHLRRLQTSPIHKAQGQICSANRCTQHVEWGPLISFFCFSTSSLTYHVKPYPTIPVRPDMPCEAIPVKPNNPGQARHT